MGFFDLSIPYDGKDAAGGKTLRVKLATKAMELGYVGIAYNRSMKGIMSEKDRCTIPLLTVESMVKVAPPLALSVGLHRDLLCVRRDTPFRQYTRLTVSVENNAQSLALNSDNPILKSYDIVAVRPLNQSAFDQACEKAKVDMISIDFSGNMPFRLKQPMVKAAIQRGIYFEIRYSDLLVDAHKRRQVISNAKLLADWTRGKNLIISSGAPSVTELRGPNDVTNLMSLLGLSTERARAAISNNCRNMISNALRKKRFYKDTVRVELVSSNERFNIEQPLSGDWFRWDPLSSGEGDMALDDLAKAFGATSNAAPKSSKAIDFSSILDDLPSHGFKVNDIIFGAQSVAHPSADKVIDEPVESNQASELPLTVSTTPDDNFLENRPVSHTIDHVSKDDQKVERMKMVTEKESIALKECSFSQEPGLMLQGQAVVCQTLIRGMELDATPHVNVHISSASKDRTLLNSDNGGPQCLAKNFNTSSILVDDVAMDVDSNEGAATLALHDMPLRRHDEKHISGPQDNTLVGDDKVKVNNSSEANHKHTDEAVTEEQKHEIGENDTSLYSMFSRITDLVREPHKYSGQEAVVSDESPSQEAVFSDQSPRLRSNNEVELREEPLLSHLDALEETTTEHKTNEETEAPNYQKISIPSREETNGSNSVAGKPRAKKRTTVHLSQLRPFKPFLHPSRFKRISKRSKHRRDSS